MEDHFEGDKSRGRFPQGGEGRCGVRWFVVRWVAREEPIVYPPYQPPSLLLLPPFWRGEGGHYIRAFGKTLTSVLPPPPFQLWLEPGGG